MTTSADLGAILGAILISPLDATLPTSGRAVRIPRYLRAEIRDPERMARAASCWAPNKPTILVDGVRTWPEYAIVRRLEAAGWEGRWIKNWAGGREFCLDIDRPAPLPPGPAELFARIHERAAGLKGAGSWDVLAWLGANYLFVESKQHKSGDRLNPNQLAWLEAAVLVGVDPACFAVVEYDAGRPITSSSPASAASR